MLQKLKISNYALIDSANIDFNSGFSVITGETGAGKSIMLGALSLILGQRSDSSLLRDSEKKCIVEAIFDIKGNSLKPLFEAEDVDYDDECIIRREIAPNGKSRAFVNDSPVTLQFLKSLTQNLIDIHSQHQNLLMGDDDFQLMIVDTVADNGKIKDEYLIDYKNLISLEKEKEKLIEANNQFKNDKDYWEFQWQQLEDAHLIEDEQAELENEQNHLSHIEEVKTALDLSQSLLNDNEPSILDSIHQINSEIGLITNYIPNGDELATRINSLHIELKDITQEIINLSTDTEYNPERLTEVTARLDLIYSLQQKHRVATIKELIEIKEDFNKKLLQLNSFDEEIEKIEKNILEQHQKVAKLAEKLSSSREKIFSKIEDNIESQLKDLGMPHGKFQISHKKNDEFTENGIDEISFLFTANKNASLSEIDKIASGGEMSRLMLSIKSLLSKTKGLPTLIFDEIDTGVSGEIADKMGIIMQTMGENIQVISITHLPQIAGKGAHHYKVMKTDTATHTVTEITELSIEERVNEIAAMLSGASITEAAITNAKTLLQIN